MNLAPEIDHTSEASGPTVRCSVLDRRRGIAYRVDARSWARELLDLLAASGRFEVRDPSLAEELRPVAVAARAEAR